MSASPPPRPDWLSEVAYSNILNDKATPKRYRLGVLKALSACTSASDGKAAFVAYFAKVTLAPKPQNLRGDAMLGHLYFSGGFYKRVAEVVGSGDEGDVEETFNVIKNEALPRRERKKALRKLERAMHGHPIRAKSPIWLYRDPNLVKDPTAILDSIDACLPWSLALPRPEGEFIHFAFPRTSVQDICRTPNCNDTGFDQLDIWNHGGKTLPPKVYPKSCGALSGLKEVVATSVTYEQRTFSLGRCVSASVT
ncbi:hypothetical protein [Bradyrhizobium sp. SZCCHNRI1029]|uniref:hypothetical protein n=1 Tax=Bradyrhizobium sp. SZCCHNRI1029 TaxID=3057278 RepID=UPI002915D85D|nr:hypothetical protein [Bradyrhizobium sp. SZCCHNRI1029]